MGVFIVYDIYLDYNRGPPQVSCGTITTEQDTEYKLPKHQADAPPPPPKSRETSPGLSLPGQEYHIDRSKPPSQYLRQLSQSNHPRTGSCQLVKGRQTRLSIVTLLLSRHDYHISHPIMII